MELWLWTCVQPPSSRQKKTKNTVDSDTVLGIILNTSSKVHVRKKEI